MIKKRSFLLYHNDTDIYSICSINNQSLYHWNQFNLELFLLSCLLPTKDLQPQIDSLTPCTASICVQLKGFWEIPYKAWFLISYCSQREKRWIVLPSLGIGLEAQTTDASWSLSSSISRNFVNWEWRIILCWLIFLCLAHF